MTTKRLGPVVPTLALLINFSVAVQAQGPGRGSPSGADLLNGFSILTTQAAQSDLNLDPKQLVEVGRLMRDFNEAMAEKMRTLQDKPTQAKLKALQQGLIDDTHKRLTEILGPEKYGRYQQIMLQMKGYVAFQDPEIQNALKLTDDQKAQVSAIRDRLQGQLREVAGASGVARQAASAKYNEAKDKATDDVVALLTDEQKAAWSRLTGEEFRKPSPGDRVIRP